MNFALRVANIYCDKLQKIVKEYNQSIHSTIKCAPISVDEKIEKKVLKTASYQPKVEFKKSKLSMEQRV